MKWSRFLLALTLFGASAGLLDAAAPAGTRRPAGGEKPEPAGLDDVDRVAAKIDEIIALAYEREKVKPVPLCDDATYLRRVSLDVTGRIGVVSDVRNFLADLSPRKRAEAVDRLLDSPGYVNHFSNIWMGLLLPEAQTDLNRRFLMPPMHNWLRKQFTTNVAYDKMVREIISLPMATRAGDDMRLAFYRFQQQATPMTFYLAKQDKPEELAASTARLFLGVRLECAQCHDHPFGKWKREEFWSQASFFAGINGGQGDFFFGPLTETADRREVNIPNTDRVAQARFLDGKTPRWKFKVTARATLADWITAKDNPFFARAMVNRMWAHFFGMGIVEPVDDIVDDNPASHPELLAFLSREFVNHDFDIKFLIRAITRSRTYQLSSVVDPTGGEKGGPAPLAPPGPSDIRLLTRMPVRGMTADQLYESLRIAGGIRDNTTFQQRVFAFGTPRQLFVDRFGEQEKKTEYQTSIPHALTMMNNQLITDATHPDRGQVLGAVVSSSFMTTPRKIDTLFLAALGRMPRADEAERMARYVERGGAASDQKKALADVFWALLNSTEFRFNH